MRKIKPLKKVSLTLLIRRQNLTFKTNFRPQKPQFLLQIWRWFANVSACTLHLYSSLHAEAHDLSDQTWKADTKAWKANSSTQENNTEPFKDCTQAVVQVCMYKPFFRPVFLHRSRAKVKSPRWKARKEVSSSKGFTHNERLPTSLKSHVCQIRKQLEGSAVPHNVMSKGYENRSSEGQGGKGE